MKTFISALAFLLLFSTSCFAQTISEFIHIDQFGYLPQATKVAVLSDPQTGFNANLSYTPSNTIELRNANTDAVVFSASPTIWNNGMEHIPSGDKGWWFDFSTIETAGTYYVYDPINEERSSDFKIDTDVYADVMQASAKMFYYNRCNFTKEAPFAGMGWTDGMNFTNALQDANCRYVYDPGNASLEKDLTGGWFDAGDYNKYVTFADMPIHNLLWAYQEHPALFGDNWNIPESGNNLPDILDEVKWELDWLMKMVNEDGSTIIKMGSISHDENVEAPPSENVDQRYYGPTCTSASIAIASMFSHAADVYAAFPEWSNFAMQLREQAILTWSYAIPLFNNNQLETDCDDGTIKAGDADWNLDIQTDKLVVAAVHLLQLTGDDIYNDFFLEHYSSREPIVNNFWSAYKTPLNDALLYYTTLGEANANASNVIINSLFNTASNNWNGFYGFGNDDLYRANMPDWAYHWGSNSPKAGFGILNTLLVKYNINPDDAANYQMKAAEQLHYFHGVNPLGLVYLSNMYDLGGDRCVNEIYHTWFADGTDWDNALTSLYGPPPGYVSGGANADFSIPSIAPPSGQPEQKSYLDFNTNWPDNSWEISEPAIYYQAIYLRLLANYTNFSITTSTSSPLLSHLNIKVFPNPSSGIFSLQGILPGSNIEVIDLNGEIIKQYLSHPDSALILNMESLPSGTYFLQISAANGQNRWVEKIIKQ